MSCPDKAQWVRLVDVFVLGPFMIWVGASARGLSPAVRSAMMGAGAATVVYNLQNYVAQETRGAT